MHPLRQSIRLLPVLLVLLAPSVEAAGPLDGLQWLAGTWERVGPDSYAEETWSQPRGEIMLGMFQLIENGKATFVELQTIRLEGDDVVLRILHASPDLVPWKSEDNGPMRYVALSLRPGEVVFGNTHDDVKQIIYRLDARGRLLVRLVKVKRGKNEFIDFLFRRATADGPAQSVAIDPRCRPRGSDRLVATDCCQPVPW